MILAPRSRFAFASGVLVLLATALPVTRVAAEPPAPATPAAAPLVFTIKMLDAGAEPRRALRYSIKKDSPESFEARFGMTIESMQMNGEPTDAPKQPGMRMEGSVSVGQPSETGDYPLTVTLTKFKADGGESDEEAAAAAEVLAQFPSLTAKGTMTSRGEGRGMQIEIPDDIDPAIRPALESARKELADSLSKTAAIFPEEPVGVGARWVVEFTETTGFTMAVRSEVVLEALEGTKGTLRHAMTMEAKEQVMHLATLPPGTEANLLSTKGTGAVVIAFDLERAMPVMTMEMKMDQHMTLKMAASGPDPIDVVQKVKMSVGTTLKTGVETPPPK